MHKIPKYKPNSNQPFQNIKNYLNKFCKVLQNIFEPEMINRIHKNHNKKKQKISKNIRKTVLNVQINIQQVKY